MAGLAAGSLSPDTSSGSRGVFVNSREVYTLELLDLQVLPGMVYQGITGWMLMET